MDIKVNLILEDYKNKKDLILEISGIIQELEKEHSCNCTLLDITIDTRDY